MRRILVVDDEPSILKVVAKRLTTSGFQVDVAMDGQMAWQKVQEAPPDLLILDVMLPRLDGNALCSLLKHDPRYQQIPIVMFTAKAQEKDYWKGMESGADAYLTKPFQASDLEQLVSRLIEAIRPSGART